MKISQLLLFVLVLGCSNAMAVTWTKTIENPVSGALIPIDINMEVREISGITVLSRGAYTSRIRTCDTPGGEYTYSQGYDLSLQLLDVEVAQYWNTEYLSCVSSSVDLQWSIESSDTIDLSFLDSGAAGLRVNFGYDDGRCGEDRCTYCCWTTQIGSFTFESLTIIVDYIGPVGLETSAWGYVKSTYR